MTASAWNTILTAAELDAHYALTASLDPRFAKSERDFYESRTINQLRVLAAQAWDCNEPTGYQLARSYLALAVAAAAHQLASFSDDEIRAELRRRGWAE